MNLGFLEGSGRGVFYPAEKQGEPSIGDQRPPVHRAKFGPGGIGREAEFPAQAQVAAWARGCAGARGWATGSWAGRAAMG